VPCKVREYYSAGGIVAAYLPRYDPPLSPTGERVEQPQGISVPIVYTSTDDAPILLANQFVLQINQDEFILLIGQLQPPLLVGTPEEQREAASKLSHVSVKTILRVAMTRTRVEELAALLTQQLTTYDEQKRKGGSG
jgi:hypothetical protein